MSSIIFEQSCHYFQFPSVTGKVVHTSLQRRELLTHYAEVVGSLLGRALRNVGFNSFKQKGEMNLGLIYFGIVFRVVKYKVQALHSYHCHSLPAVFKWVGPSKVPEKEEKAQLRSFERGIRRRCNH